MNFIINFDTFINEFREKTETTCTQAKAKTVARLTQNLPSLIDSNLPAAALNLVSKLMDNHGKIMKKDEHDSRPTNVKEVTSYFKNEFS